MSEVLFQHHVPFSNPEDQATLAAEWQNHYRNAREALGTIATEVCVRRVIERDKDIKPYKFYREARHTFVLPQQDNIPMDRDNTHWIDSTPGYSLKLEDVTYTFDPEQVTNQVVISYDDAGSAIRFEVSADGEPSEELAIILKELKLAASVEGLSPARRTELKDAVNGIVRDLKNSDAELTEAAVLGKLAEVDGFSDWTDKDKGYALYCTTYAIAIVLNSL